jgi:undecaprenyl-diphosphatase
MSEGTNSDVVTEFDDGAHDNRALNDGVLDELQALDRAVYVAIADTPTPLLDASIRHLSDAANYSKIWIAAAAGLAAVGGPTGRRAAVAGLISIGAASLIVNQGVKRVAHRARPDRDTDSLPDAREAKMPESTSFPSGHSASGFAFAAGVATQLPLTGAALRFLAGAVAYSRVHTGVHYPGDVVIGSLVGSSIGGVIGEIAQRRFG